jgi:thiosulfate/3-mercaptopyruvate sulfurtransferase
MTYTNLISAQELLAIAAQDHLVIIDCRHDLMAPDAGQQAYTAGHIPGARFMHVDQTLSGNKYDAQGIFQGRHPLPNIDDFIAKLRKVGINHDSQVIVYDAQAGMFAARLWWMLRWIGHTNVAVLNGGLPAWIAAGGPLSTESTTPSLGDIRAQASTIKIASVDEILSNIRTQQYTVVDARSPDRYRGENETMDAVGGHIPGAKNRFFKDNLNSNGEFKSAQQLQEEWRAIITQADHAIMQCGSGVTACHNLLALDVAGLNGARLYPGSWSQWSADPTRPVATGSQA